MAQRKTVCGLVAALGVFAAQYASAQPASPSTSRFFVSVNAGGQLAERTLDMSASQTVYEETATLTASLPVGKGLLSDAGVGYRVWGNVFVGFTVSYFTDTGTASYTASIPDPFFFNRPKTVTGTQPGLKHTEIAYLPQLMYSRHLGGKFDLVGAVGPAIIQLSQDSISSFTVPPGTQNVTISNTTEKATGTGINGMLGLNYNLTARFALGGYARYAGAKVQLASATDKQNVGGMQAGGGIRINF